MAHHELAFDGGGAASRGRTRLIIRFTDGATEEQTVLAPRTVSEPLNAEGVRTKFRTLTNGIVAPERQAAIISLVSGLEQTPDVGALTALLAPEVGSAFKSG